MTTVSAEPVRVLLVDDDVALTRTLEDILPLHGFAPLTAANGRAALRLASDSESLPPLALVDLGLPDMDGLDLAVQLHDQVDDIQVVILTGNGTLESAIRALRDEGCDYLLKPVDPDLLVRTLRTAEGRWRLRRAEGELRRTQELIRAVFDASPLPIVVVDTDLVVQLWNHAAEVVFGQSADEVVGQPLPIAAQSADPRTAGLLAAVLRGELLTGRELKYRRPDATLLDLRLSAARLGNELGGPGGVVAVYEDTTERRRLEVQLQDAQRLDAMGRLVGGVAHDFNNLLAVMLLEIEAAFQEQSPASGMRLVLDSLRSTAQRGATLTRQLLAFARRQPAELATYDVNDVVNDLAQMLARLAGDRIESRIELQDEAWPVLIDRGQLEQVITNLVANARDAMPDGGRITIATTNFSVLDEPTASLTAGDWVRISVTDSGTGIPEEVRAKIFEPFFTTKPRGAGTGLGLATCHGIVERLQGVITVESTVGEGSTFSVFLPRASQPSRPVAEVPVAAIGGGTETVLIVEDQPQVRAVARMTLAQQGYVVYVAASGAEAIQLVSGMARAPDLVFTDAGLPDMDGRALIRSLRERHPSMRALLTSGSMSIDAAYDEVPFLPKPYSLDGLARQIRSVLDRRE